MIHYNKGTKYLNALKYEKALNCFKKSTLETKELYLNMGNAYRKLNMFDESAECYIKANSDEVADFNGVKGLYPLALCNLGLLAYTCGENDTAINLYKACLSKDPLVYDAIWNYSTALLRDYSSGGELHPDAWKAYETRFKVFKPLQTDGIPLWDGKSKVFKLLVLAEQGFGDKIMFGRYLKLLEEYCTQLVVLVDPSLGTLFDYKIVQNTTGDYDACISFGMLAGIFGETDCDYLAGKFNASLPDNGKMNIIVEWSGSKSHANDANRSCYASYFKRLSAHANLYNVRPDAEKVPGITNLKCKTWAESAGYVSAADLVISVDTSIVHLAGSVGTPTWLLQPLFESDFRWGLDSLKAKYGMELGTCRWYKSVLVFENDGWESLFNRIEERLIECLKK